MELGEEFILGLLGADQMTGPYPLDVVPRADLSSLSSKALTCLLQGQGLEGCKPKRAARKAIQRFPGPSTKDQGRVCAVELRLF